MFKSLNSAVKTVAALLMVSIGLISTIQVQAGTIVQCGSTTCSSGFDIMLGNTAMGSGELLYDSGTGNIWLNTDMSSITGEASVAANGSIVWTMGESAVEVNWLSGNADPVLDFGVSASTGDSGGTFSFSFDLPIALQGPINASSSVSYSLTSGTSAGAQIGTTITPNIVSAFEVDTSVGGLDPLNKGVDVGNTFGFTGGPLTQDSQIFTASNTFTGNLAYDLMAVNINFSLSANSSVGVSGFVQQTPVPVPAAVWLFGSGLLGLVAVARRRKAS